MCFCPSSSLWQIFSGYPVSIDIYDHQLLTWKIKLKCQNDWNYLFIIQNIFIVGAIMLSFWNSWNSIETKWWLVSFSLDTKDSISKRKFQFKQQIFHCSKKFEMAKSRESSFIRGFRSSDPHAILYGHFHDDFHVNQKGTTPIQDFWKLAFGVSYYTRTVNGPI